MFIAWRVLNGCFAYFADSIQTEVSDSIEADEIEASTMEIENAKCLSLVNFYMKTCIW